MADRPEDVVHLHLDALGGLAGDMFLAAMLDARPDLVEPARALAGRIGPGVVLRLEEGRDKGLRGARVGFDLPSPEGGPRHYADYRRTLAEAAPDAATAARALDILERLGLAEARVHGVELADVHFHEVADWDSVADILLAAFVIERAGVTSASASALPVGGGRIDTAHGSLPVPAPATLALLAGAHMHDDGQPGERVTPTGAAIFAHLAPSRHLPPGAHRPRATGYGLGRRTFPAVANALRLVLWSGDADAVPGHDRIGVITFAVDDQSPEDLAVGLDKVRAADGVLDVFQMSAIGKKSRMASRIEVLCRPERVEDVARLCFRETTTIGLRVSTESRAVLRRRIETVEHEGRSFRVKRSERPGDGTSAKVESDDLAHVDGAGRRAAIRRAIHGKGETGTGDSG